MLWPALSGNFSASLYSSIPFPVLPLPVLSKASTQARLNAPKALRCWSSAFCIAMTLETGKISCSSASDLLFSIDTGYADLFCVVGDIVLHQWQLPRGCVISTVVGLKGAAPRVYINCTAVPCCKAVFLALPWRILLHVLCQHCGFFNVLLFPFSFFIYWTCVFCLCLCFNSLPC